jgi:aspartate/methionine/tyrosine aminotransferase
LQNCFRPIPATGVIYASNEARKLGWVSGDPDWCNLGQGQAETGPLPGAPPRVDNVPIAPGDHCYSPMLGLPELREAVAGLYNQLFRRGLPSKYTADNVAIAGGGRAALTRAVGCLGHLHLGHFLPDYTAYEELIDSFRSVTPIPIPLSRERSFEFEAEDFRKEVTGRGLGAVLLSNPSNPTGRLIAGQQLRSWVKAAKDLGCTLLLDEFYSHFIWREVEGKHCPIISAAEWIEDVDRDPVIIFDGLTKNWRYPGWRVSWTVGPRDVIKLIGNAGSFLDGGAPRPLQRRAADLIGVEDTLQETDAIRKAFLPKRDLLLERCLELGLVVDRHPEGSFYVFASLRKLKGPLSNGMKLFRAALDHKVITVPGIFFDVNPGHRRPQRHTRFGQDIRLSFGPTMDVVAKGMDRLEELISDHRTAVRKPRHYERTEAK